MSEPRVLLLPAWQKLTQPAESKNPAESVSPSLEPSDARLLTLDRLAQRLDAWGLQQQPQPTQSSDPAVRVLAQWTGKTEGSAPTTLTYRQDQAELVPEQVSLLLEGPAAEQLAEALVGHFAFWTPTQLWQLAAQPPGALAQAEQLQTLAALGTLWSEQLLAQPTETRAPTSQMLELLAAGLSSGTPQVQRLAQAIKSRLQPQAVSLTEAAEGVDVRRLLQLAEAARRAGDVARATALLDRGLAKSPSIEPEDHALYFARALARRSVGSRRLALLDVLMALALARRQGLRIAPMQALLTELRARVPQSSDDNTASPEELRALALMLTRLLKQRSLHEAEEVAEALLSADGDAGVLALCGLGMGLARWLRGRLARAVEALTEAEQQKPALPQLRMARASVLRDLGDYAAALQTLLPLLERSSEAARHDSQLEMHAQELLQAAGEPGFFLRELRFEVARLQRLTDQPQAALESLNELLRTGPAAADLHLARAVLLRQLGDSTAALSELARAEALLGPAERLLSDEDPLGTLQVHRAELLAGQGRQAEAVAALKHALTINPEWADDLAHSWADQPQLLSLLPLQLSDVEAELRLQHRLELRRTAQLMAHTPLPITPSPAVVTSARATVMRLLGQALAVLDADGQLGTSLDYREWVHAALQALRQLRREAPASMAALTVALAPALHAVLAALQLSELEPDLTAAGFPPSETAPAR